MPAVGPAAQRSSGTHPVASWVHDAMYQQVKHLCPMESPCLNSCSRTHMLTQGWEAAHDMAETKGGDPRGGGAGRPSWSFWQVWFQHTAQETGARDTESHVQQNKAAQQLPDYLGVQLSGLPSKHLCFASSKSQQMQVPCRDCLPPSCQSKAVSSYGWESKTEVPQMR